MKSLRKFKLSDENLKQLVGGLRFGDDTYTSTETPTNSGQPDTRRVIVYDNGDVLDTVEPHNPEK